MKNVATFSKLLKPLACLVLASTLLAGCGLPGSQPTISPGLVATTVAMTMQAITPQASPTAQDTAIPPSATPQPPTATSQPVPPNTSAPAATAMPGGVRINFPTGATAGTTQGQLQPGQVQNFLVGAAAGQPFMVSVNSLNNDVYFSVSGRQDGIVLLPASNKYSSWQTMLSKTEDYLVQVYAGATTENFTLNIITPARIVFDPGAVTAQRSGSTPGGLNVAYVLRANAGQKMDLQLTAPDGNAVLSVYGYQDGQPYLRYVVEQTSFTMTLPATQDYIIQVVPRAGAVAPYTLKIKIQ